MLRSLLVALVCVVSLFAGACANPDLPPSLPGSDSPVISLPSATPIAVSSNAPEGAAIKDAFLEPAAGPGKDEVDYDPQPRRRTEVFGAKDDIHLFLDTALKANQALVIRWYRLYSENIRTSRPAKNAKTYDFSLPVEFGWGEPRAWPAGTYHVDIIVDNVIVRRLEYKVQ